jgi:hypothetical protein
MIWRAGFSALRLTTPHFSNRGFVTKIHDMNDRQYAALRTMER